MEQIRTAKFESKDTNTTCLADDEYIPEEDNETVETSDDQHDMGCGTIFKAKIIAIENLKGYTHD